MEEDNLKERIQESAEAIVKYEGDGSGATEKNTVKSAFYFDEAEFKSGSDYFQKQTQFAIEQILDYVIKQNQLSQHVKNKS